MLRNVRQISPQSIYIDIDCLFSVNDGFFTKKGFIGKIKNILYGKKIDPRAYLWIDSHSEFQVLVYCDIVKFDTYNKTLPPRITRKLVPVTQPYLQKLQNRRGVVCIITDKPIQSKIKVDWKKHKYATNINRNSLVSFLDDLRR